MTNRNHQQGAALVVGLLLLVVITVLAVTGMNTATTQLAVARNEQNYESVFQAAESGLEAALNQNNYNTAALATITKTITANESVTANIQYERSTIVPDKAFTLGSGTGIAAYHSLATATAESKRDPDGTTDRDSSATHTQAFYIIGPGAPTL